MINEYNVEILGKNGKKNKYNVQYADYKCHCGKVFESRFARRFVIKSCGCRGTKFKKKDHPRLYGVYTNMKTRCYNKKVFSYKHYGGRGITVTEDWDTFDKFCEDMLGSYYQHVEEYGEEQTTIDRTDNNKGYGKDNCRWVTYSENSLNRRKFNTKRMVFLEHKGKRMNLTDWAKVLGMKKVTLIHRHLKGWSTEDILQPVIKPTITHGAEYAKYKLKCKCKKCEAFVRVR